MDGRKRARHTYKRKKRARRLISPPCAWSDSEDSAELSTSSEADGSGSSVVISCSSSDEGGVILNSSAADHDESADEHQNAPYVRNENSYSTTDEDVASDDNSSEDKFLPISQHLNEGVETPAHSEAIQGRKIAPLCGNESLVGTNSESIDGDSADADNFENSISDENHRRQADSEEDEGGEEWYDSSSELSEEEADIDVQEDYSEISSSEDDMDSNASSAEDNDQQEDGNQPLYPGAPLTLGESLLAIFTLASVEHITGKLLSRILELIALHCPPNSYCIKTLYKFKKYFAKLGDSVVVYHYFCSDCIYPLKSKVDECRKCSKSGEASFFLEVPLLHQLQNLFRRDGFLTKLQGRLDPNRKRVKENIEDIYDGQIYKEQMENGFLQDPHNLSFMLYSDGVQAFRSSSLSLWPLCLVINELKYRERILPRNILLAGIWFGRSKPNPNVFLRPLHRSMKTFMEHGFKVKLHDNSEIKVRGKIICATFDLPARSKFLSFKQYNGEYGCSTCLSAGQRYRVGRTTIQVYPYSNDCNLRTHDQVADFAQQALQARAQDRNASVFGVKGPSLLYHLLPDIIKCIGIDIMHGVFLGLCKLLCHLWFSPSFARFPWSLSHLVDIIDERIKKIKPPGTAQRAPRSVKEDSRSKWKASEYKLWFTHYSIPVLYGLMPENYLRHYCLVVSAMYLLTQESISHAQIEAASQLLHSFVSQFSNLYDIRYLGINIHQLLHLPNVVLDLGPLWAYSCFFLENFNGQIVKLFHGTQHVALQICSSATMFMELPTLIDRLGANSHVLKFCKSMSGGVGNNMACKIADAVGGGVFALGTYSTDRNLVVRSKAVIDSSPFRLVNGTYKIFFRLKKNGVIFFSEEYSRKSSRRDSTFARFLIDHIPHLGQIVRFVKWSACDPNNCPPACGACPVMYFFIARLYERQVWYAHSVEGIRLSYISKVLCSGNLIAAPVLSLHSLCFYMKVEDEEYISQPVNLLELE